MLFQVIILMGIIFSATVYGQEGAQSSWLSLSESELEKVESHSIGYKRFMCPTSEFPICPEGSPTASPLATSFPCGYRWSNSS